MSTRTFTFTVQAPPTNWWESMSVGQVKAFSTNFIDDAGVRPVVFPGQDRKHNRGVFYAWCGAVYAPNIGTHGSMLHHGGGDNDYDGNEIYRLDIATGVWSRLFEPTPLDVKYGTYGDFVKGEILPAYAGKTGVIAALHNYLALFYVPPSVAGNTNGLLCVGPSPSGDGKTIIHQANLDTALSAQNPASVAAANGWSRAAEGGTAFTGNGIYGSVAWDSTRNRVWYVNKAAYQTQYFSWATKTWTQTGAWSNTLGSSTPFGYCPTLDVLVLYENRSDANSLKLLNPASPTAWQAATMSTTNQPPLVTTNLHQLEWCGDLGCFLLYTGGGSKRIYKLTPPANPYTGTWVWTYQDFTGDDPPFTLTSGTPAPLSKFRYVPSIGCAVYADACVSSAALDAAWSTTNRAVAFKLTGT